jgi:pyruvate dehydrogenase E1 component alpha subunit
LPILFVCENNVYSSHLHIEERQPLPEIRRFAQAHDIENFSVDGNSLEDVSTTAEKAIKFCRERREPVMMEAHTYRLYGHVGYQKDESVGLRRFEELPEWEKRDPILQEINRLIETSQETLLEIERLQSEIKKYVAGAWQQALQESYPPHSDLFSNVYFEDSK